MVQRVARWCAPSLLTLFVGASAHAQAARTAPVQWRATEQWVVDGDGDVFGMVRDLAVLRDGSVWVLDFKDQVVRRFSSTGTPLKPVGRRGAGPGEMRNANGLLVHGDGTVWVNDPSNGRLSVFKADGSFARQHVLPISGYGYRWGAWYSLANTEVMDATTLRVDTTFRRVWRRVDVKGAATGEVVPPVCSADAPTFVGYRAETPGKGASSGPYPFTTGGGTAPNGRDGMWCATPLSRRVALVRIGRNDTIASTSLDVPMIPVAKAERDDAIAQIMTRMKEYATNDFDAAKVPPQKSGIGGLHVDDDGRLWVEHARPFKSSNTTFDVHSPQGAHIARVTIPYRTAFGMPVRARGMAAWFVVVDEDDVVSVAKFALGR